VPKVELSAGTIHYDEAGPPDGRPVVCVHGYLMAGDLFAGLAERLAARGLRTVMPTWPMGAHPEPMRPQADLSPAGMAALVAELIDVLGLKDAVLLGNDSGGAICQGVAVRHPEAIGAMVLTNCDAFDNFPPGPFKVLPKLVRLPGALRLGLASLRFKPSRTLAYGLLAHADIDAMADAWSRVPMRDARVRADLRRWTIGLDPSFTLRAAERLHAFTKPTLIAWAPEDRLLPVEHAERLAAIIPGARLERIADSRIFSMIDQPDRLAELVGTFAARPRRAGLTRS